VKLLLDENLSRRLVPFLQASFPGSSQVALLGLERATDAQICQHAAEHGFVVCSKDDDFQRLVAARGYQPRLIHLALGNVSNDRVLSALLGAAERLKLAFDDPATGVVVIEAP
jgi:predicted nuclease of predicted toxin-antitoxin system